MHQSYIFNLGVDDLKNDNNFGQKCQYVMLRLACSCGTHSRSRLSLAAQYVSKPLELKVLSGIDSNSKGNICGACGYSLFFQFAHWLACLLVSSTTKLSSLLFVRYQSMNCRKNVHFWYSQMNMSTPFWEEVTLMIKVCYFHRLKYYESIVIYHSTKNSFLTE